MAINDLQYHYDNEDLMHSYRGHDRNGNPFKLQDGYNAGQLWFGKPGASHDSVCLSQDNARVIIPLLAYFAEHGRLPEGNTTSPTPTTEAAHE